MKFGIILFVSAFLIIKIDAAPSDVEQIYGGTLCIIPFAPAPPIDDGCKEECQKMNKVGFCDGPSCFYQMNENRTYAGVKYRKFRRDTSDDTYIDEQFKQEDQRIPWKAIGLAAFLFFGGLTLLIMGIMILIGHLDTKYGDRTWPIFILGMLMFLPGAYHIRIAYYAYRGYQGYSFDEIPEFE